jgi:hypothetical protein
MTCRPTGSGGRSPESSTELHADGNRHLAATDPDRRDLLLSRGAALHHLQVTLAALDLPVRVHRLPDPCGVPEVGLGV